MTLETGAPGPRGRGLELAVVLLACAILAVLFTIPWYPNPATIPTTFRGSGELYARIDSSMWTYMLAWGAEHPSRFYDAPVLLPMRDPLVANDPRMTEGVWSIPLFRVLPPVLAWGVTLWLSLVLTAAAGYYAGSLLTDSRWGGAALAVLFCFGMFRANHVCHVEGIFAPFLALALATMARFLDAPDRRRATWFALALAAAAIEYSYVAVCLALTVPAVLLWGAWRRGLGIRRAVMPLLAAGLVIAALLAPIALKYAAFSRTYGVKRQIAQVDWRSADLYAWVTGPTGAILPPFGGEGSDYFDSHLFTGFAALALGLAGARRLWRRSPEIALVGVLAFILSFGTMRLLFWQIGLPYAGVPTPYEALYRLLLPLQAIRAPARFGVLTHLALAFAGALAVARMAQTSRGRALALALLALSFVEARAGMHPVRILPERVDDPVLLWLEEQPGEFAVMDAPMGLLTVRGQHQEEAETMLVSLVHGRRTPNGTVAAHLRWHESIAVNTSDPAHDEAKRVLRALGVRYVMTRDASTEERYRRAGYPVARRSPSGTTVFEVEAPDAVPSNPDEFAKRLADDPFYRASRSAGKVGAAVVDAPARLSVRRGEPFELRLTVRNEGADPWAGDSYVYGREDAGDVIVGIRAWRRTDPGAPEIAAGPRGVALTAAASLPANLLPGETARVTLTATAPVRRGRYVAELDLATRGAGLGPADSRPAATVDVLVD